MPRTLRTLALALAVVGLGGIAPAEASSAGDERSPRVTVPSPWARDDPAGDAERSIGDLRLVVVENGRQQIRLTFRMAANPVWDAGNTSRATRMVFKLDWQGTPLGFDRRVVVSKLDGTWTQVIFNGLNNGICLRDGGVAILPNHGFRITVPVAMCMGGAHVLRASGEFLDDFDDSANNDLRVDRAPNASTYGPFIRLPN